MGSGNLDGCGNCAKWSLIFTNICIMLVGVGVISVGAWTYSDKAFMEVLLRNNLYMSATYIMMGTGCAAIILAVIGWVGAFKEIKAALLTYFVLLLLLFVVLVVAGILGYIFRAQIRDSLKPEMMYTVTKYDPNNPNLPVTAAWDNTQKQLQCCGLSVQESDAPWLIWRKNMLLNSGAADSRVPDSCCRVDAVSGAVAECVSPKGDVDDTRLYRRDCYDAGTEFLGRHALVIASVALAGAAVLTSGMVFSISLFKLIE